MYLVVVVFYFATKWKYSLQWSFPPNPRVLWTRLARWLLVATSCFDWAAAYALPLWQKLTLISRSTSFVKLIKSLKILMRLVWPNHVSRSRETPKPCGGKDVIYSPNYRLKLFTGRCATATSLAAIIDVFIQLPFSALTVQPVTFMITYCEKWNIIYVDMLIIVYNHLRVVTVVFLFA